MAGVGDWGARAAVGGPIIRCAARSVKARRILDGRNSLVRLWAGELE